jgi:hypothetical protein
MARKRFSAEQIVAMLRQAEVEFSKGQKTPQICKKLGVSEQTYYRRRPTAGAAHEPPLMAQLRPCK